ncbi:LexA family transcriptional regulator [Achromobacter sp. Bel]|uniref:S24 family peptidase n=1 Tax=Achromobacter sp. Bel TaxID=2727415 RepID=UPI00145E50E8|nr:LexA family transcriptional regulator [Achromobacter sp. Bel]NMK48044.1 LexA family transcriptional regulator [Achromobacter sp. Bel]
MKMWTIEEEAAALRARFEGVNRAAFARDHAVKGGQAMIYQHITGRRPIGIEAAMAYAEGFGCTLAAISPRLALEAKKAASLSTAAPLPPPTADVAWPFPSVPASLVRGLADDQLKRLEGALLLALGQMGVKAKGSSAQTKAPQARRGTVMNIDAAADEFPMAPVAVAPWDPDGLTTHQADRAQALRISTAANVGHVANAGYSANDQEFMPIPELDVRLAAGRLGIENYHETEIGEILLRRSFLESFKLPISRMKIVYAQGDSMEPVIRNGGPMLFFEDPVTDPREIDPRTVYAINHGGKMIVKCIAREREGGWLAKSLNPAYAPFPLEKEDGCEVRIVGRILWSPYDLRNGVDERLL